MRRRRFPLWTALGAVLVVALVIGSGVLSSSPPTPAQRAAAIESSLRCPSCEDLSVAESSASTAVTVRATVTQLIAAGKTDQQIETYLADRYGSSIALDPPASGWSLLVWLLPLLGGVAALAVLGTLFVRRRTVTDDDATGAVEPTGRPLSPEASEERRRFLVQSLADADAEYLAGDLSDKDYLALRHRDMVRLSALDAAGAGTVAAYGDKPSSGIDVAEPASASVAAVEPAASDPPAPAPASASAPAPASVPAPAPAPASVSAPAPAGRSRRSWWFLGGAVASFAGALVLAVFLFASGRQPGQSVTGSFAETQQQQIAESLAQAATDENQGQLDQAAQLYQSVLTKQADNEVALAQLGWLEYQTGRAGNNASLVDDGRAKLNQAVHLDPHDYAVRLYLGTVAFQQDSNAAGAVVQYRQFLADAPPAAILKQAAPELREAYQQAGDPIPSEVAS